MASDLAFHLASRGYEVGAITSRQRYDDARARLSSDTANGVRIERVWSTRFGRGGLFGRAIDYLTFYLSAFFAMRRERDAVLIAMTDPPLTSVVAAVAGRRVVNWVQDLFPEVAEALGIRAPRVLRRIRDWSLRRARANVVLGELMASRVPKATIIHNWADGGLRPIPRSSLESRALPVPGSSGSSGSSEFLGAPRSPQQRPPRNPEEPEEPRGTPWGERQAFLVGYSGNLGRAHEFETILGAMRALPEVRFVFTGGGAQFEAVKRSAGANAEFRPYVAREKLSESLSSVDAHLVSLQPALEGLIVPSKFYGILAVARPVIFIGARDGELARIIHEHRCGMVVEPGDVEGLTRAIASLAEDPVGTAEMGRRGRQLYLARFAPERAFAAWERVLEEAAR